MKSLELLDLERFEAVVFEGQQIATPESKKAGVERAFTFLNSYAQDKIIYGINTGFGPMAQFKIDANDLNDLQYNLIRSHAAGAGVPLSARYTRAVMLSRWNTLSLGNSGISPGVIQKLEEFINHEIYPEIFEHGSVGASGDLVQLAHLGLGLIGEGYAIHKGERIPMAELLQQKQIEPLRLKLRDGLGIINGTSCMSGIAAVNLIYAKRLLNWSVVLSSILQEILNSFDDSFSAELNAKKKHLGQQEVAGKMRSLLADSSLIKSRHKTLYRDQNALNKVEFKEKIQEYYSLRCVPQILGPVWDTIEHTQKVVEQEFNSTNDNPVIDVEEELVLHGGNFHGDYISLEMDKLKLAITRASQLAERQLNFLMNHKLNEKFPPFLNKRKLGLNFGLQGMQFTATSTTAENQTLSNSMYVHSIPNNNDNQDIVSMGTNSALITKRVIDNGFEVLSIHAAAVAQAIDLLPAHELEKLSERGTKFHAEIREILPVIEEDLPPFEKIKDICVYIKEKPAKL